MINPKSQVKTFENKSEKVQSQIDGYACAYGRCIENPVNQPNGNKLCMVNYPSFEIATENCEIHKCDKIAKYAVNGTGTFI